MGNNHTISSGELVALITGWGLALTGCLNVLDLTYSGNFTLFSDELTPLICGASPFAICVGLAIVSIVIILLNLFLQFDPPALSVISEPSRFALFQPGSNAANYFETAAVILYACTWILMFPGAKILASIVVILSASLILLIVYKSNNSTKMAKLTIIPAVIVLITPFVLMPFRDFKNMKKTYIMDTTISDMNSVIITSAKKKGDFAEITTKDGRYYRININTITRIIENKESSEGAANAPQPAEQK